MKQIQLNSGVFLLVEVPLSAQGISFSKFAHVPKERLEWWIDTFGGSEYDCIDLPPGNYEIIGKGNSITEEVWRGIVDKDGDFYEDYDYAPHRDYGMKPETVVILKLKK